MGCGNSTHQANVGYSASEVGASPKKPGKAPLLTDNVSRVTAEESSDYDSDELDNPNQRSKSATRLEALAKERGDDEPEMFLWSDFVVDVTQVTKKPAPKRNPRQPIIWSKKSGTAELEGTFQFNDFVMTDFDGEEDLMVQAMLQPRNEIARKKNLDEYHIRAYEIYSLIGMPRKATKNKSQFSCITVFPLEPFH